MKEALYYLRVSAESASSAFPSPTLTDKGRRTNDEGIGPGTLASGESTFRKAGHQTVVRLEGVQERKAPIGRGQTFLNVGGLMGAEPRQKATFTFCL